jgi:hypothetical protein
MNCPKLDCPKDQQTTDPNQCCPRCKQQDGDKCVKIQNCPANTLELELPKTKNTPYLELSRIWQVTNFCNEPYTETQQPEDTFVYYDENNEKKQFKVTVKAGTVTDTCNYNVLVKDVTPPTITCPDSLKIYAFTEPLKVNWGVPRYEDNVCTHKESAKCDLVETSGLFNQYLPFGKHNIRYEVTDRAGLKATCDFEVELEFDKTCATDEHNFKNGHLECDKEGPAKDCELKCDTGFEMYYEQFKTFSCNNNEWSPPLRERLLKIQCRESTNRIVMGSVKTTGVACPKNQKSKTVGMNMKKKAQNIIGNQSGTKVMVNVRGCDSDEINRSKRSNSFEAEIILEAIYKTDEEKDLYETKIGDAQTQIENAIKNGDFDNLGVALSSAGVSAGQVQSGCPGGSEMNEERDMCFLCPPGFYESGGKCKECAKNEYQDLNGQTQCAPCPEDRPFTEMEGSSFLDECVADPPPPTPETPLAIIIGVCVAGGVLIIIIIIIVVVIVRKKRKASAPQSPTDKSFNNKGFEQDHTEYAEIDEKHVSNVANKPENPYEKPHLYSNNKEESNYDKLQKK